MTMEKETKRTIAISLATAKEWYKKGGELREIALQAFSTEEITGLHITKVDEGVKIIYNDLEFTIVDVDFGDTYNYECATTYAKRLNCHLPNEKELNCIHQFFDIINHELDSLDLSQYFWSSKPSQYSDQAFSCNLEEENVDVMWYKEYKEGNYNGIMLIK
jgi:hypothetical protein